MRLRSLIPVLTVLATAGCDSTGALKLAQAPAPKPADCCCKPAATPATCPPVAAPTPIAAQPAAMTPELEQPAYRPAVHRQTASSAARRVTHVQRRPTARHVERDYGEVGEYGEARAYGYAQQRAYAAAPAPEYDGYIDVPDRRIEGRVEDRETFSERYSEQSEGYGGRRYAGGYEHHGGHRARGGYDIGGGERDCGDCAPREAAGRDRNGFLTWPGKVPARP